RLRLWRGLGGSLTLAISRPSYESIWRDLFFNQDQSQTISISIRGTPENTRTLSISYEPRSKVEIPMPSSGVAITSGDVRLDSSAIVPITFQSQDSEEKTQTFQPRLTSSGLALDVTPNPSLTAFFSSSFAAVLSPSESASQFSELSKRKQGERV